MCIIEFAKLGYCKFLFIIEFAKLKLCITWSLNSNLIPFVSLIRCNYKQQLVRLLNTFRMRMSLFWQLFILSNWLIEASNTNFEVADWSIKYKFHYSYKSLINGLRCFWSLLRMPLILGWDFKCAKIQLKHIFKQMYCI